MGLDFRTANTLWSSVCIETLHLLGLTTAIICPGSRSTPFIIAFAKHSKIEAVSILDERSAAFFALGLAKRSHRAVAIICTSGTAGANFYPAVIEAHMSRVPLLVLTADRPPEMRDCNAGQAIDQQKLYGSFVNWYVEMAIPSADTRQLAYARQTMVTAWERSHFPTPGPVHLNLPFRDPLAPIALNTGPPAATAAIESQLSSLAQTLDSDRFFAGVRSLVGHPDHTLEAQASINADESVSSTSLQDRLGSEMEDIFRTLLPEWQRCDRLLIIVGPVHPAHPVAYCQMVAQLSELLGCPVLAEGLSPLRNYASLNAHLISTYDTILRNPADAERLAPDGVIRLGDMPTSKVLRQWLVRVDPLQWMIDGSDRNLDPGHGRTVHVRWGSGGGGGVGFWAVISKAG
ncbi:MAG: 2-succinyl-5-enolpyruvyl-6-hydroxy-3-cyclohexene-1-carboxylic-acid synthase [Cyanobacteria bacterium P01_F01_bin.150]